MLTRRRSKNIELWKAVNDQNVTKVRNLLKQRANPSYSVENVTVIERAIKLDNIEIVNLLVENGANVPYTEISLFHRVMRYFLNHENQQFTKEIAIQVIERKYNKNNVNVLHGIFCELALRIGRRLRPDILQLLFDYGYPIDDFIPEHQFSFRMDTYTPLHLCIFDNNLNLVQELLKHGADVNKRTGLGLNSICVAASWICEEPMIRMLVEKGLQINEKTYQGKTALHKACEMHLELNPHSVNVLLAFGADANIKDDDGMTPLMYTKWPSVVSKAMIQKLAKMKFENLFICPENLECLEKFEGAKEHFEECLEELRKMQNHQIYGNLSLYEILQAHRHPKRLIFLAKNKNFVAKFNFGWDRNLYHVYVYQLEQNFMNILQYKDSLVEKEKELYSVLKDYLPELVLSEIAYYMIEDFFFE